MYIKREDVGSNSNPSSYQSYEDSNHIKQEIKIETGEIEIKREVENNNFEQIFIPERVLETRNEDSFDPVTVKKECESEEEDSDTSEDTTTETSSHNNIKLEDIKDSATENEHFSEDTYNSQNQDIKKDIDLKEHSLEIKEECMTKTLDGSTSQAVKGTNEKPKEIAMLYDLKLPFGCNKPFACLTCKKTFTHRHQLTTHMRFHSEKSHKCRICQKAYIQKGDLKSHMRIHTGERPHACNVCNKTYIVKTDLTRHLLSHSSERPYECGVCDKKFRCQVDLNRHLKIHSGEKPFECEICSKKIIQKCNFVVHMRIHSGERPFECEICKERFISKRNLSKHLQIHSGDRPFECEVSEQEETK